MTGKKLDTLKVDLHIHTTASDGTWRPGRLVENVCRSGLGIFAVTDHDSVGSVPECARLADENGLIFVPGVEVKTNFKGRGYHILGLGIDPENKQLSELLDSNTRMTEQRNHKCTWYLERNFPGVSVDEYVNYDNNPERGGWKALNYAIDKKLCRNHREYFNLFRPGENPYDEPCYASPGEAVEAIEAAGGIPVLAHPGVGFYDPDYKAVISHMLTAGIKGIECFHPDNSPEVMEYSLEACARNHLFITGGSDCHGDFVVGRCLGKPDVRLSQLVLHEKWTRGLSI